MKDNLDQKLENYEAASKGSTRKKAAKMLGCGAAATAGLLTCNQAEADIIYSGPQNLFFTGGAFGFDIDNDGSLDFAFGTQGGATSGGAITGSTGGFAIFGGTFAPKGGFAFQGTGASAFPAASQQAGSGGTVSFGNVNTTGAGWMGWASSGVATTDVWGVFANPGYFQTGYVGVQFNGSTLNGATAGTMNAWFHVAAGWADLDNSGTINPGDQLVAGVLDWAYNNDPTSTNNGWFNGTYFSGTPGGIHIGAVPEPSSLGLLSLMALGAAGMRRRKKIQKTAA